MKSKVLLAVLSGLIAFTGIAVAADTKYKCDRCKYVETYSSDQGPSVKCPKCGFPMGRVRK